MAREFSFTDQKLRKLPPPKVGRDVYRDTKVPGLILRVTAAGAASFFVYKKFAGAPVRLRIGSFPGLTVEDARGLAVEALAKMARGDDPRDEKRQARSRVTVGEVFTYFLETHGKVYKRSWREDQKQYDRYLRASWGGRRVDTIHKDDLSALHKRVGEKHGHYAANRLRALLHTMFRLAIQDLGLRGPNPVQGVRRFKEQSRERFLQATELPKFFSALATVRVKSPTAADLIEVALWCGARRGNVLAMRWDELDLDRAVWTIPAEKAKAGDPLTVHLPEQAVAILKRRRARAKKGDEWVFPGRREGKHMADPTKPWKAVCEAAGISDLRLHDLRRTLGSWAAGTGASLPIIGKALGHRHHATTAVYARLDLSPVREAVNRAADAMKAAAEAKADKDSNS